MLVKDIFSSQIAISSEILTTIQESHAFIRCCDLFFGAVRTLHYVDKTLFSSQEIKKNTKVENDELELAIGTFKVIRIADGVDFTIIAVEPLNYEDFELDISYREDFRMVCDFVIRDISTSNLDILKGIGIEQIELPNIQYQEVKDSLSRKYSGESGVMIIGSSGN